MGPTCARNSHRCGRRLLTRGCRSPVDVQLGDVLVSFGVEHGVTQSPVRVLEAHRVPFLGLWGLFGPAEATEGAGHRLGAVDLCLFVMMTEHVVPTMSRIGARKKKVAHGGNGVRRNLAFYHDDTYPCLVVYRSIRFASVQSTNDVALAAARAGEDPGLVVWSDVQTGGKGRSARDWVSPEGGLWVSFLLDVDPPEPSRGLVPLAIGCACCRALDDLGAEVQLRWPNDLMRGEDKLGGILIETRSGQEAFGVLVAGIGINVVNEPPLSQATNLADLAPTPAPADVLDAILERLGPMQEAIEQGDADRICRVFMENAWGMGEVMLLDGEPVIPKDVAIDGALIVEDPEGEISVHRSGSLRPAPAE